MPKTRKQKREKPPAPISASEGPPKHKRQRKQPQHQEQKKEKPKIDSDVFEHHLAAAKPIIIKSFSPCGDYNSNVKIWESLADTNWQHDVDICAKALSCGLPVETLQGSKVLNNVQNLIKFIQSTKSLGQAKELWETIDEKTQCNKTLAFAALDRGVPFTRMPKKISDDSTLLKDGLEKGLFEWKALPKALRADVEFALCAFRGYSGDRTYLCPEFSRVLKDVYDKEKLWLEWACKYPHRVDTGAGVWGEAPASIISDSNLMLKAISKECSVILYVHSSLSQDLNFLTTALKKDPLVLYYLNTDILRLYPSLLDFDWIRMFNLAVREHSNYIVAHESPWNLKNHVPSERWSDREFVMHTWLKAGSPLIRVFPKKYFDDEEMLLTYGKHFYELWGEQKFGDGFDWWVHSISKRLRNDKTFIKKLMNLVSMQATKSLISGSCPLSGDFELQIMACSKWESYRPFPRGYRLKRNKLYNAIRGKLRAYRGFSAGFLCGIKSESSQLSILDQGPDASIKTRIASFLDFPTGELLTHLLRAARNLNLSPDDDDDEEVLWFSDSDDESV